jgi:aspartate carbamoyltransferase catalytic subunit
MNRLGGRIVGFAGADSSSSTKGETISDTVKTVSNYVDIIAMRHPQAGSAEIASKASFVPLINAGDGDNQHPTQTLTDLLTIKNLKGSLENHVIGLCGDLKYGRTVHSLVKAMSNYEGIKFIFISPDELRMPDSIKDGLDKSMYEETDNLESVLGDLDVLYMTRVQRERFDDIDEYERLKDSYIINSEKIKYAKSDMIVMHPLPRVNEISTDLDDDDRAVYFKQTKFGMYMRMALIMMLLNKDINM